MLAAVAVSLTLTREDPGLPSRIIGEGPSVFSVPWSPQRDTHLILLALASWGWGTVVLPYTRRPCSRIGKMMALRRDGLYPARSVTSSEHDPDRTRRSHACPSPVKAARASSPRSRRTRSHDP